MASAPPRADPSGTARHRSPEQRKTHLLIDRAAPLVSKLLSMSRLKLLRPLTREGLDLLRLRSYRTIGPG